MNYRSIRIPEELVKTVEKEIIENTELGYRSHSEFIMDVVGRRVEELITNKINSKIGQYGK